MDPMEFVPEAQGQVLQAIGAGFYHGCKSVASYLWNKVASFNFLCVLFSAYLIWRACMFAVPREAAVYTKRKQFVVRLPAMLVCGYMVARLGACALRGLPFKAGQLWQISQALLLSSMVEHVVAMRTHMFASGNVFTYGEIQLLELDVLDLKVANVPQEAVVFMLLVMLNQLLVHVEALVDLRRYRFYTSGLVSLSFLGHFVYLTVSGKLANYVKFGIFAVARFAPFCLALAWLALCGVIYLAAGLLDGSWQNMAMRTSHSIYFSPWWSFSYAVYHWVKLALSRPDAKGFEAQNRQISSSPFETAHVPVVPEKPVHNPFYPVPELLDRTQTGFQLIRSLYARPEEEDEEDEWVPDSEAESESETEMEIEMPPLDESLAICGVEILDKHMGGRLTRRGYNAMLGREYIARKQQQQQPQGQKQKTQCVVCLDAPRNIVVWPCGCLCLCDECRLALGIQNTQTCVCCRQPVTSFSRIYHP